MHSPCWSDVGLSGFLVLDTPGALHQRLALGVCGRTAGKVGHWGRCQSGTVCRGGCASWKSARYATEEMRHWCSIGCLSTCTIAVFTLGILSVWLCCGLAAGCRATRVSLHRDRVRWSRWWLCRGHRISTGCQGVTLRGEPPVQTLSRAHGSGASEWHCQDVALCCWKGVAAAPRNLSWRQC